MKLAPVDLPELVAEVLEPYRAGLAGRIEIHNDAAGPLPQVVVDRTLVQRALANIVENALHAMPGAGALSVDASAAADVVVLTVRDTGVGMDEEALARVFEPYFSTKSTGTGSRPADRPPQHRVERRDDRGRESEGPGHDRQGSPAGGARPSASAAASTPDR